MSCTTQNQQPVTFSVSMGSLPEGLCGTQQELGNEIAKRLIIQLSNNFSTFVAGATAPTSNVGPWLKNCEHWMFFNDALGIYTPDMNIPLSHAQYFSANDNFTVPDDVYLVMAECWGAGGGGGGGSGAVSASGGGGGGYGFQIFSVTPAQSIPVVVGVGGAAGVGTGDGGAGSQSSFLTLVASGGTGGANVGNATGGLGGSVTGSLFNIRGSDGMENRSGAYDGAAVHGGNAGKGGSGGSGRTPAGISPGGGGCGYIGIGTQSAGAGAAGGVLIRY